MGSYLRKWPLFKVMGGGGRGTHGRVGVPVGRQRTVIRQIMILQK